jgi:hypothetical protein
MEDVVDGSGVWGCKRPDPVLATGVEVEVVEVVELELGVVVIPSLRFPSSQF